MSRQKQHRLASRLAEKVPGSVCSGTHRCMHTCATMAPTSFALNSYPTQNDTNHISKPFELATTGRIVNCCLLPIQLLLSGETIGDGFILSLALEISSVKVCCTGIPTSLVTLPQHCHHQQPFSLGLFVQSRCGRRLEDTSISVK